MTTQKILFIANIEHLQISEDLETGEKVADRFRITNSHSVIHELITPVFRVSAGELEASYLKKTELYRAVKKAYGIRSKVVHGVAGSPKLRDTVKKTANVCDEVARRVLVYIISDSAHRKRFMSKGGENDMEEYLLSLVLGPPIK